MRMLTRQDGDEEDDEDAVLEGGNRVVEVEELQKRFGWSQSSPNNDFSVTVEVLTVRPTTSAIEMCWKSRVKP